MTFPWRPAPPATRAHRHDLRDPSCRAATLAELRRSLTAAHRLAAALELGGEALDGELRLIVSVLASLDRRVRQLEQLEARDGERAR